MIAVNGISQAQYQLDILLPEKPVYVDRTYEFLAPIPEIYQWQNYIVTLNDDKNSTGDGFLSFEIDNPATVIVALDDRIDPPPAWLAGWEKRTWCLWTTDSNSGRVLYARDFPAGLVTLGANREESMPTGPSMYSVVLISQGMTNVNSKNWMLYE